MKMRTTLYLDEDFMISFKQQARRDATSLNKVIEQKLIVAEVAEAAAIKHPTMMLASLYQFLHEKKIIQK